MAAVMLSTTAEEAAAQNNGVLVDSGPYKTYDDAYDAIVDLMDAQDDRDEQ